MNVNSRLFGSQLPDKIQRLIRVKEDIDLGAYRNGLPDGLTLDNLTDGAESWQIWAAKQGVRSLHEATPFMRMWTAVEVIEKIKYKEGENFRQVAKLDALNRKLAYQQLETEYILKQDMPHAYLFYDQKDDTWWVREKLPTQETLKIDEVPLRQIYVVTNRSPLKTINSKGEPEYTEDQQFALESEGALDEALPGLTDVDTSAEGEEWIVEEAESDGGLTDGGTDVGLGAPGSDVDDRGINANDSVDLLGEGKTTIHDMLFPSQGEWTEIINDERMKSNREPAEIIDVTSSTVGTMGLLKETTVTFKCYDRNDFDKIYNRFFLRPGAQIFVDFGWNHAVDPEIGREPLYNPVDLLNKKNGDQRVQELLTTARIPGQKSAGVLAKNFGDMDVICGLATNYTTSVDYENFIYTCSVTITSKNAAMLQTNIGARRKERLEYLLDDLIAFEALYRSSSEEEKQLLAMSAPTHNTTTRNILAFEDKIDELFAESLYADKFSIPSQTAVETGIFKHPTKTDEYFINWGILEDRIFNAEFGFGADLNDINRPSPEKTNYQVSIDSSESYTTFKSVLVARGVFLGAIGQHTKLNFVYPENWNKTYNTKVRKRPGMNFTWEDATFQQLTVLPLPPDINDVESWDEDKDYQFLDTEPGRWDWNMYTKNFHVLSMQKDGGNIDKNLFYVFRMYSAGHSRPTAYNENNMDEYYNAPSADGSVEGGPGAYLSSADPGVAEYMNEFYSDKVPNDMLPIDGYGFPDPSNELLESRFAKHHGSLRPHYNPRRAFAMIYGYNMLDFNVNGSGEPPIYDDQNRTKMNRTVPKNDDDYYGWNYDPDFPLVHKDRNIITYEQQVWLHNGEEDFDPTNPYVVDMQNSSYDPLPGGTSDSPGGVTIPHTGGVYWNERAHSAQPDAKPFYWESQQIEEKAVLAGIKPKWLNWARYKMVIEGYTHWVPDYDQVEIKTMWTYAGPDTGLTVDDPDPYEYDWGEDDVLNYLDWDDNAKAAIARNNLGKNAIKFDDDRVWVDVPPAINYKVRDDFNYGRYIRVEAEEGNIYMWEDTETGEELTLEQMQEIWAAGSDNMVDAIQDPFNLYGENGNTNWSQKALVISEDMDHYIQKRRAMNFLIDMEWKNVTIETITPEKVAIDYTKEDKGLERIPIREVFVSTGLILKGFDIANNPSLTVKGAIEYICSEINQETRGVWNWKVVSASGDDSSISIVDANYMNSLSINDRKDAITELFAFQMPGHAGTGTVVTSDSTLTLDIPPGDIGSMYAIQGLSDSNQTIPIDSLLDSKLSMNSIHAAIRGELDENGQYKTYYASYIPNLTGYRGNSYWEEGNQEASLMNYYQRFLDDNKRGSLQGGNTYRSEYDDIIIQKVRDEERTGNDLIYQPFELKKGTSQEAIAERKKQTAKIIKKEKQNLVSKGYAVAADIEEYFLLVAANEFFGTSGKQSYSPTWSWLNLTLHIHGLSVMQPGDIFTITGLPDTYKGICYFQVIGVTHELRDVTWVTKIETLFRVIPGGKDQSGLFGKASDVVLDMNAVNKLNTPTLQQPGKTKLIKDGKATGGTQNTHTWKGNNFAVTYTSGTPSGDTSIQVSGWNRSSNTSWQTQMGMPTFGSEQYSHTSILEILENTTKVVPYVDYITDLSTTKNRVAMAFELEATDSCDKETAADGSAGGTYAPYNTGKAIWFPFECRYQRVQGKTLKKYAQGKMSTPPTGLYGKRSADNNDYGAGWGLMQLPHTKTNNYYNAPSDEFHPNLKAEHHSGKRRGSYINYSKPYISFGNYKNIVDDDYYNDHSYEGVNSKLYNKYLITAGKGFIGYLYTHEGYGSGEIWAPGAAVTNGDSSPFRWMRGGENGFCHKLVSPPEWWERTAGGVYAPGTHPTEAQDPNLGSGNNASLYQFTEPFDCLTSFELGVSSAWGPTMQTWPKASGWSTFGNAKNNAYHGNLIKRPVLYADNDSTVNKGLALPVKMQAGSLWFTQVGVNLSTMKNTLGAMSDYAGQAARYRLIFNKTNLAHWALIPKSMFVVYGSNFADTQEKPFNDYWKMGEMQTESLMSLQISGRGADSRNYGTYSKFSEWITNENAYFQWLSDQSEMNKTNRVPPYFMGYGKRVYSTKSQNVNDYEWQYGDTNIGQEGHQY